MKERDFKGIWIPKEVWLSADLTLQEKIFYVEIDSLDNDDGCWANNEYFANFFSISKVRVSEVISSLVEKGVITAEVNQQMGNKRTLKTLANFSLRPSQTKVEDPHKGSFKHSNTFNNTFNKDSESSDSVHQKPLFYDEEVINKEEVQKESKKTRAKEKNVDPAFPEFIRIWVEAYPDLGFSPVDGKKIKSLIDKTKKYLVAGGKESNTEAALAMFQYVVNYLKRGDTWFAGKDLAVIDSKYLSIIFEIKNGKQRTSKAPSARDIINSL